jgi:6-methylsalicylate decarboxylase
VTIRWDLRPIFDLHQHLWPPSLIELLNRRRDPPHLRGEVLTTVEGSFPFDPDVHDLRRRLADLDRWRIDVAVVSLQPTIGLDLLPPDERREVCDAYNSGIAELVVGSGGRLRAFSAGVWQAGFAGVCVGASQALDPGALEDNLTLLEEANGVLFVHPSHVHPPPAGAPPWWTAMTAYTSEMQAAYLTWVEHGAPRWPRLRVVFSLLAGGAPFQLERLGSRGVATRRFTDAPLYLETSSYGRSAVDLSIAALGIDRIVHGSDYPVIEPVETLDALARLGPAAFASVVSENPSGLLGPS